jgi:hypothetical protein
MKTERQIWNLKFFILYILSIHVNFCAREKAFGAATPEGLVSPPRAEAHILGG